ncbi:trypsin-like serine protease [Stigmatella sp. ncwal1]|uniref:Trypsin-like serine protease n=1 Tax=Stigmatella ashevillensis TaxID=2995309 RepID=A0ABT5DPB0_9BACT|nr:trypsin-like serine protease [Stigmatella ashevillena]MDC0714212.1 trypsin-like serine protease [Stigmatella ashevillena]
MAAITVGTVDEGDPAVVSLVDGLALTCTGTLIANRVVLTAAHCITGGGPTLALFGTRRSTPEQVVDIIERRRHPDFDAATLRADLGLLFLASAPGVAPLPLPERRLDSGAVGQALRVVGFGTTAPGAGDPGIKRVGRATLTQVNASTMDMVAAPSQPCDGDSGGSAFLIEDDVEVLAGVISAGDASCARTTHATRIDTYRGTFIEPFLVEIATELVTGERCVIDANCASGHCQAVAGAFSYCTAACSDESDCSGAMVCGGTGTCAYPVPTPGGNGSSCDRDRDCVSDRCARPQADAPGVCAERCFAENQSACPGNLECEVDMAHPGTSACFTAATVGGCSVSSGLAPWPLALVLGASLWRRQRQARGSVSVKVDVA